MGVSAGNGISVAQNIFYILVMASLSLLFSLSPWCRAADSLITHSQMVQLLGKNEGKECRGASALHSRNWSLMNTRGLRDIMTSGTWLCMMLVINACCSWSMSSQDLMILVAIPALPLSGKGVAILKYFLKCRWFLL